MTPLLPGLAFTACLLAFDYPEWSRAIEAGDFEKFKKIVEGGLDVKTAKFIDTPMEAAAQKGDARFVRYLEEKGVKMTINEAAEFGDLARVRTMLKEKPWLAKLPNAPLFGAARNGNLEMTKLLLAHGADVHVDYGSMDGGNYTPLAEALRSGFDPPDRPGRRHVNEDVAIELLKHGADPHVSGGKMVDDIVPLVFRYGSERLMRAFLEAKADPYVGDWYSWHAFQRAASDGDLDRVELLLKLGLDTNRATPEKVTPLLAAALSGNRDVAQILHKGGARLDLYSAAVLGDIDSVLKALDRNPELLKIPEPLTKNPLLFYAAQSRNVALVKTLLEKGADPQAICRPVRLPTGSPFENRDLDEDQRHWLKNNEKSLAEAVEPLTSPEVIALIRAAAKVPPKHLRTPSSPPKKSSKNL